MSRGTVARPVPCAAQTCDPACVLPPYCTVHVPRHWDSSRRIGTIHFVERSREFPKLRPVAVRPSDRHPGAYDVTDPSGIAPGKLTLSLAVTFILSHMNGKHRHVDIQAEFMRRHGTLLFSDDLDRLLIQLDEALFLDSPAFAEHLDELTRKYRDAPARPVRDADAFGAPADQLGSYLDAILDAGDPAEAVEPVLGLVAPHLDYERGKPCYAAAYRDLARRTDAARFVILGTNHFGRSSTVVGTRKDFETPLGAVPHDAEFISALDRRFGADLFEMEYDHLREHSVELQVLILKHVLGARRFTIVPLLCPDPTGVAPTDDRGGCVDSFATALREEIDAHDEPTCLIAAADLSHVGRFFQDDRDLNGEYLGEVEQIDRRLLSHLLGSNPASFKAHFADSGNPTDVCSAGCLYVLSSVLEDRAKPRLLRYHQAVTREAENCVTCAAVEFTT